MVFEKYYAAALGRVRIAVTTDTRPVKAWSIPAEIEDLLLIPASRRTAAARDRLLQYYLSVASGLAAEHGTVVMLRTESRTSPTTLVLSERPPQNPPPTYLHLRGEFLQPAQRVIPHVLS